MNWMRAKLEVEHLRERPRDERLRQAGVVLDQHVPVGQDREQHDLELGPLADNGPLHLVEHGGRSRADLLERQVAGHRAAPICSMLVDGALDVGERGARRPWRSPGGGRSAAHELPRLRPEGRPGRLGVAVEVDARPSRGGRGRCRAGAGTAARAVSPALPAGEPHLALHRAQALGAGRSRRASAIPGGCVRGTGGRSATASAAPAATAGCRSSTVTRHPPLRSSRRRRRPRPASRRSIGCVLKRARA